MSDMTPTKRLTILAKTDGRCLYCGVRLSLDTMTVDHVVPRAKGGVNAVENCAPCCFACNRDKGKQSLEEWRRRIGRHKEAAPRFSSEQRTWLAAQGFVFPDPGAAHQFWFERKERP